MFARIVMSYKHKAFSQVRIILLTDEVITVTKGDIQLTIITSHNFMLSL